MEASYQGKVVEGKEKQVGNEKCYDVKKVSKDWPDKWQLQVSNREMLDQITEHKKDKLKIMTYGRAEGGGRNMTQVKHADKADNW